VGALYYAWLKFGFEIKKKTPENSQTTDIFLKSSGIGSSHHPKSQQKHYVDW
jgi:hypothetical protein